MINQEKLQAVIKEHPGVPVEAYDSNWNKTFKVRSCAPYYDEAQNKIRLYELLEFDDDQDKEKWEQQLAARIRERRDHLLSLTDWRFRVDLNPSQAWVDYCQDLRDITDQETFPYSVIWPVKPST